MDLRKCPVTLDPSLIPTDVTFVIDQCGSEVKAHRLIMAMGSPVCMKQFYGLNKETKETIPVKETTKESFVTMVDFLYSKAIDWKGMTVEELFNVANMAEKYHIDALTEAVKEAFEDYPLSEYNVVICASHALECDQFEEPSRALLLHCSKFLKSVLTTAKNFEAFAANYSDTDMSEAAFKLLGMMSKVPWCDQCGRDLETCRRGKAIIYIQDIIEGDKVMISPEAKDPDVDDDQREQSMEGIILTIILTNNDKDNWVRVKFDEGYVGSYYVVFQDSPTFLFCKC